MTDATHGVMTQFEVILALSWRRNAAGAGYGYTYTIGCGGTAIKALIERDLQTAV